MRPARNYAHNTFSHPADPNLGQIADHSCPQLQCHLYPPTIRFTHMPRCVTFGNIRWRERDSDTTARWLQTRERFASDLRANSVGRGGDIVACRQLERLRVSVGPGGTWWWVGLVGRAALKGG